VAGRQYWKVLDIVNYSGLTKPLSITIFNGAPGDDSSDDISTSVDLRLCSEGFLQLATLSRLRHLAVESSFIPHSVQSHPAPLFSKAVPPFPLFSKAVPPFPLLHSLHTRTTADLAWRMLSMTSRLTDLLLNIVGSDAGGATIRAATSLLPRLATLKLTFWHRSGFKANRDLAALARLDGLRVLDIRHKATADAAPTPADPEICHTSSAVCRASRASVCPRS
jgi:hypothetical protein